MCEVERRDVVLISPVGLVVCGLSPCYVFVRTSFLWYFLLSFLCWSLAGYLRPVSILIIAILLLIFVVPTPVFRYPPFSPASPPTMLPSSNIPLVQVVVTEQRVLSCTPLMPDSQSLPPSTICSRSLCVCTPLMPVLLSLSLSISMILNGLSSYFYK